MSTTSDTNVILNGIETLALNGAQTIYVRDSSGMFSKMCLDISNGGTGANTKEGARTAPGLAAIKIGSGQIRNVLGATFSWEAYSERDFVSVVYQRVSGYISSDDKIKEKDFFSDIVIPAGYRPASKVFDAVFCSVGLVPYTETAIIDKSGRVGLNISSSGALHFYGGFDEACVRFKVA